MYLSQLCWRHEFQCCVIFMSENNNISLLFVVFDLISDHMNVIGMCFYFFPIHSSNINFRCLENSTNVYDHLNFSFLQPSNTWSGSDLMGSMGHIFWVIGWSWFLFLGTYLHILWGFSLHQGQDISCEGYIRKAMILWMSFFAAYPTYNMVSHTHDIIYFILCGLLF